MDEWTEADGTIYRKRDDGSYEVIAPKKAPKKAKKAKSE
jgi:hypothetical protein